MTAPAIDWDWHMFATVAKSAAAIVAVFNVVFVARIVRMEFARGRA